MPIFQGGLTTNEARVLLGSPEVIIPEIDKIVERVSVADTLLTGKPETKGAAVVRTWDSMSGESEDVAEGAEYPLFAPNGKVVATPMRKRGLDVEITDENVSRDPAGEISRALNRLGSSVAQDFDRSALVSITSQITATYQGEAWDTTEKILSAILGAQAQLGQVDTAFEPDIVAVPAKHWAIAMAKFIAAGIMPREQENPMMVRREIPFVGLTLVKSSALTEVIVADSRYLGGIAWEKIGSPGYTMGNTGVELKSWRPSDSDRDVTRLRARRVAVPYVEAPQAAVRVTGHGL